MKPPTLRRSALSFGVMCLLSSSALALRAQAASAEQERLGKERQSQQELAKRRMEEAKARADGESPTEKKPSAELFNRLITLAGEQEASGNGERALRLYDLAMEVKPADLPEPENARMLRLKLVAHRQIVPLTVKSDGKTWVSIVSTVAPCQGESLEFRLSPGEHVAMGRRKGYRDVRVAFTLRPGETPAPLMVVCTQPVPVP